MLLQKRLPVVLKPHICLPRCYTTEGANKHITIVPTLAWCTTSKTKSDPKWRKMTESFDPKLEENDRNLSKFSRKNTTSHAKLVEALLCSQSRHPTPCQNKSTNPRACRPFSRPTPIEITPYEQIWWHYAIHPRQTCKHAAPALSLLISIHRLKACGCICVQRMCKQLPSTYDISCITIPRIIA
jgi:hypothetical protein